ncbi:MFS transporter (plasmid) [Ralstonia syzygii]|uniref:MFS transporter n=1 Tax=Ralstonia syzygii TaxID=28097 RepID=A0ABX7ZMJ2_9RALS|nr:MFS transporter [Ralstonia syzygii]QUP56009.1 MFS transporter [Ralstonia syzygii]
MPDTPDTLTPIRTSDLPGRLDRLPWSRFHTRVVIALGITWLLDGLEVTLAGAVAGALKQSPALRLTNAQVGATSSAYLAGAVAGALLFGWLADRLGRRRLFFVTLGVYISATLATAFSWDFASLAAFRALTGAGIGGEYAAINSTIQELTPARVRGWTDLAINGTFWVGAALGAGASLWLLDPAYLPADMGWRLCFFIGAALGLVILVMRFWIPESPRWLLTRGRHDTAQAIVRRIEDEIASRGHRFDDTPLPTLRLRQRPHPDLLEAARVLFVRHRQRALVGLALMSAQAFFYNAIFFTYALVLTDFYGVPATRVGSYLLPFALGNFLGPLLLGRLFDVIGRRPMIAATYALSGLLLLASGALFKAGVLDSATQTLAWTVVFFFASAAASSAYLTVSETFPLEVRALAIALFYAVGTGLGGVAGPVLFGWLIDTRERGAVFGGYAFGAVLMLLAAAIQARWGTAAERRPLEHVAAPLSADDGPG